MRSPSISLLTEALFLVFADGRKGTSFLPSANSRKRASASREAHDVKHVFSFPTLRKYRDPSDQSRSLIISPVPRPMSSTAYLALFAKKLYIGETGRRLGDRFREHLRDVEKDDQNASKPVARHLNNNNNK